MITWTPLLPSFAGPDITESAVESSTRSAVSASDGSFDLDCSPVPDVQRSVLWCTHPNFEARSLLLGDLGAPAGPPEVLELEPASNSTALVLGFDGKPVVGASVVERINLNPDEVGETEPESLARRVLVRTFTTDGQGKAVLHRIPARVRVCARKDDLQSRWHSGSGDGLITLHLHATFRAEGRVVWEPGASIEAGARVRCGARWGTDFLEIESIPVRPDATWGPATLPLIPAGSYAFILEGGTLGVEQITVDAPRPEATVTVDFYPKAGWDLAVRIVNDQDENLPGATAIVLWNSDGEWIKLDRKTDSDGIARFRGCPSGEIWVRGRCPGHAPKRLDPLNLDALKPEPVLVQMERAGRIEGRCLHHEKPVEDFTVLFWLEYPWQREFIEVQGSRDGSFTIDEAPAGEINILAYSEELPRSPSQRVPVHVDQVARVELSLPDPIVGRGRVVDGLSGEPVLQALVQANVLHENRNLKPWGSPKPVDESGKFEIAGFVEGHSGITVTAPGYATRSPGAHAVLDQPLDFGVVPLFPKQSIEVELISKDAVDWSRANALLQGTKTIGPKLFSADGHLKFSGLDAGVFNVSISLPDGSLLNENVILRPGMDLVLTERLDGRRLTVEILPEEDLVLPEICALTVAYTDANGVSVDHTYRVQGDRRVEVSRVEGEDVVLQLENWDRDVIYGCERIVLGPKDPMTVQLRVNGRQRQFRVVGASRDPIENAYVVVTLPGDRSGWVQVGTTDGEGLCSIALPSLPAAFAATYHYSIGFQPSKLVDLESSGGRPVELVLSAEHPFKLQLLERQTPAAGVEAWTEDSQGISHGLAASTSDDQGVVAWVPMGEGELRTAIRQPGYWPSTHQMHVTGDGSVQPIQVRRVGSVVFQAETPYGNPASDVAIDMRSEESGESVSQWIASGLVISPDGGTRTDANGKLRLNALPNGPFRWRATTSQGDVVEGEVSVPPHGVALVSITTP